MKKKIISLLLGTVMMILCLTGCVRNDIGIKINSDGTGAITATVGIEKEAYQQLKSMGSDPFEGKEVTESTYEDKTYVSYEETKVYSSYDDMERALLDMTYDTDLAEEMQNSQNENSEDEIIDENDTETVPEQDNHIFSSVNIEKNSGIFYSSYTFNANLNPQITENTDNGMSEAFKMTLTVQMPDEITQAKNGVVEGNKVTFDVKGLTAESHEIAATCETNNVGVVAGVALILIVAVICLFCIVKFKK